MSCGPWSAVQGFTTAAPTPGNVTGITVTNITQTGALASWNATTDNGVVGTSFNVQHVDASGTAVGSPQTVTGTSVQFSGLYPGSPFHFTVQACN